MVCIELLDRFVPLRCTVVNSNSDIRLILCGFIASNWLSLPSPSWVTQMQQQQQHSMFPLPVSGPSSSPPASALSSSSSSSSSSSPPSVAAATTQFSSASPTDNARSKERRKKKKKSIAVSFSSSSPSFPRRLPKNDCRNLETQNSKSN